MGWFKKKADPISDRARALNEEIAAIESKIKRLDSQIQQNPPRPAGHFGSTAYPRGRIAPPPPEPASPAPVVAPPREPIFEEVDLNRLKTRDEGNTTPEHYNELGVRKYDLPALIRRLKNQFSGPSTTNPKLVNYLAAGGIQGLRPMRYEKRVARNRFIALVAFLFLMLLGIIIVFVKH